MKQSAPIIAGIFSLYLIIFFGSTVQAQEPQVQLAILLDTSNSMDGLIDQAKTQLWKIVNELARAKRDGKSIELQVALYEYGKDSLPAGEGYLRMITPLTDDLDRISDELFKLKTNGGSEYCGQVIHEAVQGLQWHKSNHELKLIFIAGNEPFTQGRIDYRKACKAAIAKGIIVNTIFCGNYQKGISTSWKDGADLADGKYMNIDQNQKIVHIDAPQDKELIKLGQDLNATYIAYGRKGGEKKERQKRMDSSAQALSSEVMAQRAVAKASSQYKNISWDLVDADKEGEIKVEELDEAELPAEMKNMNAEERKQYVEEKGKKRAEIQKQINQLNEDRRKYVAEQMKNGQDNTLDVAIIKAIQEQARKKNFSFK